MLLIALVLLVSVQIVSADFSVESAKLTFEEHAKKIMNMKGMTAVTLRSNMPKILSEIEIEDHNVPTHGWHKITLFESDSCSYNEGVDEVTWWKDSVCIKADQNNSVALDGLSTPGTIYHYSWANADCRGEPGSVFSYDDNVCSYGRKTKFYADTNAIQEAPFYGKVVAAIAAFNDYWSAKKFVIEAATAVSAFELNKCYNDRSGKFGPSFFVRCVNPLYGEQTFYAERDCMGKQTHLKKHTLGVELEGSKNGPQTAIQCRKFLYPWLP
jgi:hypothetical protein